MAIKGVTNVGDLSKAIYESVVQYTEEVQEDINKAAEQISKEVAIKLNETSPRRKGEYAKGWKVKKIREGDSESFVTHNATNYQLTHLLEKTHALRDGGRSKPIVHIAPIEEEATTEFYQFVFNTY